MLVMGIHGGEKLEQEDDPAGYSHHDGAAVLIRDGEVIAAIEEERLNRVKHSNCFPARAIQYCLQQGNCTLRDIDFIATNTSEFHADSGARYAVMENPRDMRAPDGRSHFSSMFQKAFGIDVRDKIYFCHHHYAHAWSAYLFSGFKTSLVFSVDGDGDGCSGMVMVADGRQLRKLQDFKISQSLGQMYEKLMRMVGYDRFDEYKVMGLAPYGRPEKFRKLFQQCYKLLPDGNYRLEPLMNWFATLDTEGLTVQARRKGDPFLQVHKDFAAALQEMTETIAMHVLRHYREVTGEKRLCMAGGVAHNCSMNGKILYSGLFDEVFVQPAAHDSGGALGAAMAACYEKGAFASPGKLAHVYWGSAIGANRDVEIALEHWSGFLKYERVPDIISKTAKLLAEGAVVGWVQGRSEFGPRALGNRSILADPRPTVNKLRINEMVKKREEYRPFAPSVLKERIGEFFEVLPGQDEFPFMSFALQVRASAQELLGATTHVDGTARVQSVSRSSNPKYWELIREFERLTGVPVLLNTSFNNDAEPIVDSVDEAVGCFLTTGIDYLVVGDYYIQKKSPEETRRAVLTTVPGMPPSRKLVKRTRAQFKSSAAETYFAIESAKSPHFATPSYEISSEMFQVLQGANGLDSFQALMRRFGVEGDKTDRLLSEMMELWSKRILYINREVPAKRELLEFAISSRRLGSKISIATP
jgi:carbamoyltransferase